jgi:hypothetical protein
MNQHRAQTRLHQDSFEQPTAGEGKRKVCRHAVERFAEKSGLGCHRLDFAREAVQMILQRGRLQPLPPGRSGPRLEARDRRFGRIIFGLSPTGELTTTVSVTRVKGVSRGHRTNRRWDGPGTEDWSSD